MLALPGKLRKGRKCVLTTSNNWYLPVKDKITRSARELDCWIYCPLLLALIRKVYVDGLAMQIKNPDPGDEKSPEHSFYGEYFFEKCPQIPISRYPAGTPVQHKAAKWRLQVIYLEYWAQVYANPTPRRT